MKEVAAAMRDRVLGVRVDDSPVLNYVEERQNGVHTQLECLKQKIENKEWKKAQLEQKKKSTIENNVRKLERGNREIKALAQSDVQKAESGLEKLDERMSGEFSPLEEAKKSFKASDARLKLWVKAVGGRTAYSEKLDNFVERKLRFQKSGASENINARERWPQRYRKQLIAFIGIIGSIFVLAPLDVMYIAPAFSLLVDSEELGVAMATFFVVVLIGLATVLPSLFRACTQRAVVTARVKGFPDPRYIVKTEINKIMLAVFAIVVALVLSVILFGASLRSHVPELISMEQRIDAATALRQRALDRYSADLIKKDKFDEEINLAATTEKDVIEERAATKKQLKPVVSSDFFLSMSLYLGIVMVVFVVNIMRTDPIFEYYLANKKRNDELRRMHSLDYLVSELKQQLESQLEKAKGVLAEKGDSELIRDEAIDMVNVTVLDEDIEKVDEAIWELKSKINSIKNHSQESAKHSARRYAKAFQFLTQRRGPMEEYNAMFNSVPESIAARDKKRVLKKVS